MIHFFFELHSSIQQINKKKIASKIESNANKTDNNYYMVVTCFIICMSINRNTDRKRNKLSEFFAIVVVGAIFLQYLALAICTLLKSIS